MWFTRRLSSAWQNLRPAFLALLYLTLAFFLPVLAVPVAAENFVVDTAADAVDANLNDGVCLSASGHCTLRAAIMQANHLAGRDNIFLQAATNYALSIGGSNEDSAFSGDLDIHDDVFIIGTLSGGEITSYIDGTQIADRIFDISTGVNVRFEKVGIKNGRILTLGGAGGGIRSLGNLSLFSVKLHDNTATEGAAVYNEGNLSISLSQITNNFGRAVYNRGNLLLQSSNISQNEAGDRPGGGLFQQTPQSGYALINNTVHFQENFGYGNGIGAYVEAASDSFVYISNAIFHDNDNRVGIGREDLGGGLYVRAMSGANVYVRDASFMGNRAHAGGGIYVAGEGAGSHVYLSNLQLVNNIASGFHGGGMALDNVSAYVSDSVFDANRILDNTTPTMGGGIYSNNALVDFRRIKVVRNTHVGSQQFGIGIALDNSSGVVDASMVHFNGVSQGDAVGGGIYIANTDQVLEIVNTSISDNVAAQGGGLYLATGSASLLNTTLSFNEAGLDGANIMNGQGVVSLQNTLTANNTAINACAGLITDLGNNLQADGSCGFAAPPNGEDPLLADGSQVLQVNIPNSESPALDQGLNDVCPWADIRNAARHDGACDIGAVEVDQASPGSFRVLAAGSVFTEQRLAVPDAVSGRVDIVLQRGSGTEGPLSVDYFTGSGSAVSGDDFVSQRGQVQWQHGDAENKVISIALSDTDFVEDNETFLLFLVHAKGGSLETVEPVEITIEGEVPRAPVVVPEKPRLERDPCLGSTACSDGGGGQWLWLQCLAISILFRRYRDFSVRG